MQKIRVHIHLTAVQTFYVEKSIELLSRNTIDTFRLRLNNPKSAIQELLSVCKDLSENKLKNHDYALKVANEVERLMREETYLKFSSIGPEFFEDSIKKFTKDDYLKIVHCCNLLLKDNSDYAEVLFEKGKKIIKDNAHKRSLDFEEMTIFGKLIQFQFIELISLGYSKYYLFRFVIAIFSGFPTFSFYKRYDIISSLRKREIEKFEIILGLDSSKFDRNKVRILDTSISILKKRDRKRISDNTNKKVANYLEKNKAHVLLKVELKAQDYYRAYNQAKSKISNILDVLHYGHSDKEISLIGQAAVIGERNPSKSDVLSTSYQIDGFYRSSQFIYNELVKQLGKIYKKQIATETINKINAAIRYLRIGTESNELENKFVNYWIGLEYIFSTYDAETYTIERLRKYLKRCHALIFLKRNLSEFHKEIKKLELDDQIPDYHDNLQYLKKSATYETLIRISSSPLLKYRAQYYLNLLNDTNKVRGRLETHQKDLDGNLTRIYRIRNEIVHNAATKDDIFVLCSHLRYYLTFILNGLINFLIDHPTDVNFDGQISIDDYFVLQDLTLSSLEKRKSGIQLSQLIDRKNPLELLI